MFRLGGTKVAQKSKKPTQEEKGSRTWVDRTTSLVTLLASFVAVLVSSYSLIYIIKPSLKPPEKLGATISKVEVEKAVARGDVEPGVRPTDDPGPSTPGNLVMLKIDLQGFQERTYVARLLWVNAKDSTIGGSGYSGCPRFSPEASADAIAVRCWVTMPERKGDYRLRAELMDLGPKKTAPSSYDPRDVDFLDFAHSKLITFP
jgi:hypothetical protein